MAIKRTINSAAPTTNIKAPLKKVVVGAKKDEQTIKPEEEVIEEVESVTEIPFIPDVNIPEPFWDIPVSAIPEDRFSLSEREKENKLANEKRFAKIALAVGIGILVIILLNKK